MFRDRWHPMGSDLTWLGFGDSGYGDEIALGMLVTTALALATLPVGLIIGFLLATAKQSRERTLRLAADIYTTIFRSLPELVTMFLVYYGLQLGIREILRRLGLPSAVNINSFVAGLIALGLVFSAYASEILLSAFRAISNTQYEAGDSLGLRRGQTLLKIIAPQVFRIALPGLGNQWMELIKSTALVSAIGLPDILRQTGLAARITGNAFYFYAVACLLYLILTMASSIVIGRVERWLKRSWAT